MLTTVLRNDAMSWWQKARGLLPIMLCSIMPRMSFIWSLVPSKYIEFRNRDEQIDFDTKMKQLQADMRDLLQKEEESKQQLKDLFNSLGYGLE